MDEKTELKMIRMSEIRSQKIEWLWYVTVQPSHSQKGEFQIFFNDGYQHKIKRFCVSVFLNALCG